MLRYGHIRVGEKKKGTASVHEKVSRTSCRVCTLNILLQLKSYTDTLYICISLNMSENVSLLMFQQSIYFSNISGQVTAFTSSTNIKNNGDTYGIHAASHYISYLCVFDFGSYLTCRCPAWRRPSHKASLWNGLWLSLLASSPPGAELSYTPPTVTFSRRFYPKQLTKEEQHSVQEETRLCTFKC